MGISFRLRGIGETNIVAFVITTKRCSIFYNLPNRWNFRKRPL